MDCMGIRVLNDKSISCICGGYFFCGTKRKTSILTSDEYLGNNSAAIGRFTVNRVDELANMDVETITALLIEGQKKILAADLAKGFSISYRDATGQLVREYPDGRIEPIPAL